MSDTDWFTSPESAPRTHGGRRPNTGGARPGAGRKRGGQNRFTLSRCALLAAPGIQVQHIKEALRFSEYMQRNDWRRARIAFEAGREIFERVWPVPRSNPVEITVSQRLDVESIFAEVEAGNLRPTDAVNLLRIQQDRMMPPAIVGSDPREVLTSRLTALIARRPAELSQPIGFHNPPSEEQSEPASSPDEQAPQVDEDELVARLLEAVERKLEGET